MTNPVSGAVEAVARAIWGNRNQVAWEDLVRVLPSMADSIRQEARAAISALAQPGAISDAVVEAYQNELSRQIGATYMRTPEGTEEVRHAIAAALTQMGAE